MSYIWTISDHWLPRNRCFNFTIKILECAIIKIICKSKNGVTPPISIRLRRFNYHWNRLVETNPMSYDWTISDHWLSRNLQKTIFKKFLLCNLWPDLTRPMTQHFESGQINYPTRPDPCGALVIIVEGVHALQIEDINKLADLKIYMHTAEIYIGQKVFKNT